ncbi:MAG: DUF1800 domain-containing protein [Pyrinomonadaceae bacterium]
MTSQNRFSSIRQTIAAVAGLSLLAGLFGIGGTSFAQKRREATPGLTDEQRIVHVLNRLGFGARPGDVARVEAMGVDNYINQQLNPQTIPDTVAENKIKDLASLNMTTAELYEKYPQPGQLLRQLQARGALPPDLAEARDNRVKGESKTVEPSETTPDAGNMKKDAAPAEQGNPLNNQKYREVIRDYYMQNGLQQPQRITSELQAARILRAVYSERQLQEVMVDFWTNHFNVFAGKGADRWLLPAYDRDSVRPNALGKFSELLLATAQSPAMLFYLDNFQSVAPNAQRQNQAFSRVGSQRQRLAGMMMGGAGRRDPMVDRNAQMPQQGVGGVQPPPAQQPRRPPAPQARRGINENYARELMELHTLGVDGGYTQKDVQEVARCFTGWTILAPRGAGAAANSILGNAVRENAGTFFFNGRVHDEGEKIVLGHKIPAGGGMKDGLMVLDILAHHPATAKFIATKLSRHFVSDNPPTALVDRVAAAFTRSDGDIKETLKAIFFSPEFNSADKYRAKIKRPFELVVSAIRTLGADTNGGPGVHQWIARMGEPLYGFQTPNGYSDIAESWVNTGGLLERMNFGLALASNRVPGTRVNLSRFIAAESSTDKARVMDQFLNVILAGDVSPATKEALLKQMDQQTVVSVPAGPPARVNDVAQMEGAAGRGQQRPRVEASINDPVTKIVGLILGTPEFQRQ